MNRRLSSLAAVASLAAALSAMAFPEPSKSPIAWELQFKYAAPQRIVVETPGSANPKAYWYVTYTVTNPTEQDQTFLPTFEWVTKDGAVVRSDKNIPAAVFDQIKARTGNKLLESALKIAGTIHQGEDQAKDGVAIWEEPQARLGDFMIFVTGLSGESTPLPDAAGNPMKDAQGRPMLLFKTMQIDYRQAGDEVYPGNDLLVKRDEKWVMR